LLVSVFAAHMMRNAGENGKPGFGLWGIYQLLIFPDNPVD
jgi:hypothetical protein